MSQSSLLIKISFHSLLSTLSSVSPVNFIQSVFMWSLVYSTGVKQLSMMIHTKCPSKGQLHAGWLVSLLASQSRDATDKGRDASSLVTIYRSSSNCFLINACCSWPATLLKRYAGNEKHFFRLLLQLSIKIKALICSKMFPQTRPGTLGLTGFLPLILTMVINTVSNVVMSIYERLQCAHEKSQ